MTKVTNVSRVDQVILPHTWRAGETLDVSPYVEQIAHRQPTSFKVDWDDGIKHKTAGKLSHLSVLGYANPLEGYGLLVCTSLRWLEKRGVHVSLHYPLTAGVRSLLDQHAPDILALADRPDKYPTKVGLQFGYPLDLKYVPTPVRVLSTMYETRLLPDTWHPDIHKADALIVPCEGQVPIFRDSGCTQPIYTVPSGFDMANWPYVEREERETFTFISWSRMSSRKMPLETIQCFLRAFPTEQDVRLVMKTRNGDFGAGRFGMPVVKDPRITIIDADWPQAKLLAAAAEADCGIFLSHGEGFYQGPIQAMAVGLPVIGPDHSGCSAWADPKYCYVVGLDPKRPYESAGGMGTRAGKPLEWWNPDLDATVGHMRHVYEHRKEARAKGKKASAWVHKKFSEEAMVDALLKALNAVA